MAENEELKLTVTLDDQASAQLDRIRRQLGDLSSDAPGGLGRVRRQAGDTALSMRGLENQFMSMATRAGVVGGLVGGLTVELGRMGLELASRAADFQKYADSLVTMSQRARDAATSTAQFRANVQAFRESGVGAEAATRNLEGFSAALADLSRVNSRVMQELLAGARGEQAAQIQDRIRQIMSVDRQTAMTIVQQWGEQLAREYAERGQPELGRQVQRQLYEIFGAPDLGNVRRAFTQVEQWQKDLTDARAKDAAEYQTQLGRYQGAWERITDTISAIVLPVDAMKTMADYAEQIATAFERYDAALRAADERANKAAPRPESFWERLNPWDPRNIAREQAANPNLQTPAPALPGVGNAPGQLPGMPQFFTGPGAAAAGGRFRPDMAWAGGLSGEASTNIEDRREQTSELEKNTEELKRLNDFLQGAAVGAPEGALGFLGTRMGGLGPGLGYGTGAAGALGGPMGGLPGMGGGGGGGAPYGSSVGPGTGEGAGQTPATGAGQVQWPAPPSTAGIGAGPTGLPAPGTQGLTGGPGGGPAGMGVTAPPGWGGGGAAPAGAAGAGTPGGAGVTDSLLDAIQKQEGYFPGSMSYRNNNPGNIKWGPRAKALGATGPGAGGHAIFPDYQTGRNALRSLIETKGRGQSLAQIGQWYAEGPQGGANWAAGVARAAGVQPGYIPAAAQAAQGGAGQAGELGTPGAAVDQALKLQGLNERSDRDTIAQYLRTGGAGMDPARAAWCAAFVNSSLQQQGIKGSGSAVATSFLRWGQPVSGDIQKGDVLVQARGRGPGQTGGHVGMATGLTRVVNGQLQYQMLSGNKADAVRLSWESSASVNARRAIVDESAQMARAAQRGPEGGRITGGVPFLSAGMPGMPAAEALDTAPMDRAPSQRVDVNGTGKISVDVKAPSGTKVAAEGEGLFKKTEVARQTQMEPAKEGPSVGEE